MQAWNSDTSCDKIGGEMRIGMGKVNTPIGVRLNTSGGRLGALGGLNVQAVYNLARDAGFSPDNARSVVAIAMRESGLDPSAIARSIAGSTEASYGLMQINMNGSLGAQRLIQFGLSSADQLLDPATNIRAAYILSGGSNF